MSASRINEVEADKLCAVKLKPKKIKRPMNAFMVWSSVERKKLAEKEPRLHNTELSKRLGHMWKTMTEHEKLPFRKEADKLKAKLMEEHPDYKYKPRRRKLEANNKNSFLGSMNGELDRKVYSPSNLRLSATTASDHHCFEQSTSQSAWNSYLHGSEACLYRKKSTSNIYNGHIHFSTSDQLPFGATFYANHTTTPPHFLSNALTHNGYGSKNFESEVAPLESSSYAAIPTPYKKTLVRNPDCFNGQPKLDPHFEMYHFPLETPPCSPNYYNSPHQSQLAFPTVGAIRKSGMACPAGI